MRTIALIAVAVAGVACSSGPRESTNAPAPAKEPTVKITQFYANPPSVPKGEKSLLCYGVEGAASVAVDPAVQALTPALTRCFEVRPTQTTTYTLTATGKDGSTAKQTATVTMGAAAPRLFDLSINKTSVAPGEQVAFCFQASNATKLTGGPGHFMKGGNVAKDCLGDQPKRTTTYKITVSNADGLSDSASMTVEVK